MLTLFLILASIIGTEELVSIHIRHSIDRTESNLLKFDLFLLKTKDATIAHRAAQIETGKTPAPTAMLPRQGPHGTADFVH